MFNVQSFNLMESVGLATHLPYPIIDLRAIAISFLCEFVLLISDSTALSMCFLFTFDLELASSLSVIHPIIACRQASATPTV